MRVTWAILGLAAAAVVDDARRSSAERVKAGECATDGVKGSFDPKKQVGNFGAGDVAVVEENLGADLIEIKYAENFKIVHEKFSTEQYILTQCGTTPPTDAEVDAVAKLPDGFTRKFFTIPLQRVIAETTVVLGFLDALDLGDRIEFMSGDASAPCFQKAVSCGAGVADATEEHYESMDAVFKDCDWGTPMDCSALNGIPNAIHLSTSYDPGPLHSAEHIKFIAAFFNKEDMAKSLFEEVVSSYTSAKPSNTLMAWVQYNAPSDYGTENFKLSLATYKMMYVTHAGAKNVDREAAVAALGDKVTATEASTGWTLQVEVSAFASKAEAAAAFFAALGDVDVVIDETYGVWGANPNTYTFDTFLSNYGLEAGSAHKFVAEKKVIRTDGTHTPTFGFDWFESRLARPDWAIEGLKRAMGDDSFDRHYFRNIAAGEVPEVIEHTTCTETLPQCTAGTLPEAIPMMLIVTPDDVSAAPLLFSIVALLFGEC